MCSRRPRNLHTTPTSSPMCDRLSTNVCYLNNKHLNPIIIIYIIIMLCALASVQHNKVVYIISIPPYDGGFSDGLLFPVQDAFVLCTYINAYHDAVHDMCGPMDRPRPSL